MRWTAWASTADTRPDGRPPAGWTEIGWVDTDRERDLGKYVQGVLNIRAASSRRTLDFYVSVDPDVDLDTSNGFWLAVAPPSGQGPAAVSTAPVTPRALAHRPPEAHPGLKFRPVPVGVRCTAPSSTLPLFERRD